MGDLEEMGSSDFGDERLRDRFLGIAHSIEQRPASTLPEAIGDWASLKAAYRFFDNDKVNCENILNPHIVATTERIKRQQNPVLLIQDTTFLNYTSHWRTVGLSHIGKFSGNSKNKINGILMHSLFAVSSDGVPLGLAGQKIWTRKKKIGYHKKSGKNATRVPIKKKESFRWIEMLDAVEKVEAITDCPVITVADRESDIFEFVDECCKRKLYFLIRVCQNRLLESGEKLFSQIGHSKVLKRWTHNFFDQTLKKKRQAKLELRFYRAVILPSPGKRNVCQPQEVTFISVKEKNPPHGVEALDWKLLTNSNVESPQQAKDCVSWYQTRWSIEIFHKILKSGCLVEKCRLNHAEKLKKFVTFMSIIAWRIFYLTKMREANAKENVKKFLSSLEIKLLKQQVRTNKKRKIITLNDAIRGIACLGGFLDRVGDGPPGPITMWRGYRRLADMVVGVRMMELS